MSEAAQRLVDRPRTLPTSRWRGTGRRAGVRGVEQSGIGREGGHDGMLDYLESRYIAVSW
jgi:acyl-CoA reductase-like NAD-dependent aldehyde dehydrogenase